MIFSVNQLAAIAANAHVCDVHALRCADWNMIFLFEGEQLIVVLLDFGLQSRNLTREFLRVVQSALIRMLSIIIDEDLRKRIDDLHGKLRIAVTKAKCDEARLLYRLDRQTG